MTYETASTILARHFVSFRPSSEEGKINVLCEYTLNGVVGFEWEVIDMTKSAIFDWLGY